MTAVPLALALLLVHTAVPRPADTTAAQKYLPDETDMVVSANVRQILDSAAFRKYGLDRVRAWLKDDPRARVMSLVGLDPLRDIRRVVVAGPASLAVRSRWLAVIQGHFEVHRIHSSAELLTKVQPARLKLTRQAGVALYEVHGRRLPQPVFAAFLDDGTLIASPVKGWVTDAVLKHAGKKAASLNKDLQALLAEGDDSRSLWLAGVPLDLVRNQLASNPRLRGLIAGVHWFAGQAHVTDGARAVVRIETDNARIGLQIRRLLEGARAVIILALTSRDKLEHDDPLLAGLLDSFRMAQDEGTIALEAAVTADQIDQWIHNRQRKDSESNPAREGPPPQ